MKQIWTRVLSGAALACAGAAHADVIDFEGANLGLLADGDYFFQGDYFIQTLDATNGTGQFDSSVLAGQVLNGSDPSSCLDGVCPAGNSTNYLAAFDNTEIYIAGSSTITLSSFDAVFLPPSGVALPTGTVAYVAVEADRADGSATFGIFSLNGPATGGVTSFASYAASSARIIGGSGTLTSGDVVDLRFYSYYCGTSGICSAFDSNKGQFAIDNVAVNVSSVPEPAEWVLLALGLGAVGYTARRRTV